MSRIDKLELLLKDVFGYSEFRKGQKAIIQHILNKENTLGIMPTGGGKSVCYQLPALILPGLTLVVSPLISLMKDQVDSLNEMGIKGTFINSTLSAKEQAIRFQAAATGKVDLLYIAPERMATYDFQQLLLNQTVDLLAIDEAHCISQWGHDFRPSYLTIVDIFNQFQQKPVVVALTATATPKVAEDITKLLQIDKKNVVKTGFARKNLSFNVVKTTNRDLYLLEYLKVNAKNSGIVYASTRKEVERLYSHLKDQGILVGKYHGGMTEQQRSQNQEDFLYDRIQVMVATNAFGMGIDKSNIRFVIHYQIPGNLESYYQEVGRAGRDGSFSEAILLYAPQDLYIQSYFIKQADLSVEMKKAEYEKLEQMKQYAYTMKCLQSYILEYFGEHGEDCQHCSNCLDQRSWTDMTVEAQMILSCVKRMGERFGKGMVGKVLIGSKDQKVQQWQFNQLSTFGLMKQKTLAEVVQLIEYLTIEDCLNIDIEEHNILKITPKGFLVLRNQEKIYYKTENKVQKLEDDTELFEALKGLRLDIAEEKSLPPYIIFSDKALKEMCYQLPNNRIEMLEVKGVGQNKLDQYGDRFLNVIRQYIPQ